MSLRAIIHKQESAAEDFENLCRELGVDAKFASRSQLVGVDLTQEKFDKICQLKNIWTPNFIIFNEWRGSGQEQVEVAHVVDKQDNAKWFEVVGVNKSKLLSEFIRNFSKIDLVERFKAEVEDAIQKRESELSKEISILKEEIDNMKKNIEESEKRVMELFREYKDDTDDHIQYIKKLIVDNVFN
jgi:Fe2+ transport system protein B